MLHHRQGLQTPSCLNFILIGLILFFGPVRTAGPLQGNFPAATSVLLSSVW